MNATRPTIDSYISIPFAWEGRDREGGVNCWGLVRLFYKEQFDIDLPSYVGMYADEEETREIARFIAGRTSDWIPVTGELQFGDALHLICLGVSSHVGVHVGQDEFLHVRRGVGVSRESLVGKKWSRRLQKAYRYPGLSRSRSLTTPSANPSA